MSALILQHPSAPVKFESVYGKKAWQPFAKHYRALYRNGRYVRASRRRKAAAVMAEQAS